MTQPNYLTHHITVRSTLANPNNFTQTINLDFEPHEVIVRSVGSFIAAAQAGVYEVRSSLINNRTLCIFTDNDTTFTGTSATHRLTTFSNNSQYSFSVFNVSGGVANLTTQLMIHLEFRRYI